MVPLHQRTTNKSKIHAAVMDKLRAHIRMIVKVCESISNKAAQFFCLGMMYGACHVQLLPSTPESQCLCDNAPKWQHRIATPRTPSGQHRHGQVSRQGAGCIHPADQAGIHTAFY